jgi:hypothetical protein
MRKRIFTFVSPFILLIPLLSGCNDRVRETDALFELLPSDVTGITFNNKITTDDSINILSYEYLYNGGGVGIGDFNNDGLPDVFFSGNMLSSKLYLNKGNFQFDDITSKSGIDTEGYWAYGVSVVDINQDGLPDIYLCSGGIKNRNKDVTSNRLYINQGDLTFVEAASKYGLADLGETIQTTFFDYDLDGDLDAFLLKGGGFEKSAINPYPILKNGQSRNTDRLYRNDPGADGTPHFSNISQEAGILTEGFGLGVSVLDVNDDGWPDLYVSNDYLSKDHLYVNNRNGTFTDRIDDHFKHLSHFAMGNDVGDINNDGRMDVFTVDMLPEENYERKLMIGPNQYDKFYYAVTQGYGFQYMRNTLQLNNGNGSFSEVGQFAGVDKTNWSWGPLIADFDNDGFQDIVVTNGYGKDVTNLDYVKFRTPVPGMTTEERRQQLLDRPPIILPNYAYRNNHDNTFINVSRQWGFDTPSLSSGMAYADMDVDGDLDLIINNIDQEAFVYRNTLYERKSAVNFIKVKLAGPEQNKDGLGAMVLVTSDGQSQVRYHQPVRGFESTVENILHFGLGADSIVRNITVTWGDGRITSIDNPGLNSTITVSSSVAVAATGTGEGAGVALLTASSTPKFKHSENEFNDFLYQPLLQHKLSQDGPAIAIGDINKDGMEDIFFGGSYRTPGYFMIQKRNGQFEVREFTNDFESEDMGAMIFDADNDGDEDMYVVSGGVEFYEDHVLYQDRLYVNDGKGNFKIDTLAVPKEYASGSCVSGADYDNDGDIDLFVGGRSVINQYPTTPRSFLLRNDKGKFTDVTSGIAPGLSAVGMVTAALWTDFDNDNAVDLVVTGEGMAIRFYRNTNGKMVDITVEAGMKHTEGFWNSLISGDFDNDGDTDYVAGNLGLNGPMKASADKPVKIYYADFDANGSVEPIFSYYEKDVSYPVYSLDILASQVPSFKKKMLYHRDYAKSSVENLIGISANKNVDTVYCRVLESAYIQNNGNGKFELTALPGPVQIAPVFGMLAEDIDADGNMDLLLAGNSYSFETVYGRMDASIGSVLKGDGKGNFKPLDRSTSGFFVDGDAKAMARLETANGSLIVVTQNNDSTRSFRMTNSAIRSRIKATPAESYALIDLGNGTRKVDLTFGSAYLSKSSRTILVSDYVTQVQLFDSKGKETRKISFRKPQ